MKIYVCAGISPPSSRCSLSFFWPDVLQIRRVRPCSFRSSHVCSQNSTSFPPFQSVRVSGFSSLEFLYLGGTYSFRRDLSHNPTAAQDTAQNRHSFPAHRASGAIPSATPYYLIYDSAERQLSHQERTWRLGRVKRTAPATRLEVREWGASQGNQKCGLRDHTQPLLVNTSSRANPG